MALKKNKRIALLGFTILFFLGMVSVASAGTSITGVTMTTVDPTTIAVSGNFTMGGTMSTTNGANESGNFFFEWDQGTGSWTTIGASGSGELYTNDTNPTGLIAATSTEQTITVISDGTAGSYQVRITLIEDDNTSYTTTPVTVTVTAGGDTTPPTSTITDPTNGATLNSASADPYTITGTASDTGGGTVTLVEVSINGGAWQTATGTTSWSYSWTLPADGSYTIQSRATDDSSNEETPSAGNTVTVDRTDPSSTVSDPTNGATLNSSSADPYTISGTASDATAVSTVEVSINGGAWQTATGTTSWTYSWTLPADGSYTIQSRATDSAGNVETPSAGNTVTVERTPPTSNITDPTNGATLNLASPDPYTISGTASDATAVSTVEVSINGGAWQTATGTTSWTYSWTLPADGSYTIQSRATDSAGNVETPSAGNTVTVDRTAPSVSLTDPFNTETNVAIDSDVTITWDENIACATVDTSSVTISPAPATSWTRFSCTESTDTAVFRPVGQADSTVYTVTVSPGSPNEVEDLAGNPMGSPHIFSYTTAVVDTVEPTSTITAPTNGAELGGGDFPYTITGTATDNVAVSTVQVSINGGAWQTTTITSGAGTPSANWEYTWTLPADGSYTIQSRATDSSSNVETPSAGISVTVDATDPSSSIIAPTDGATLNIASPDPYTISGSASDTGGGTVTLVEVNIAGGGWQTATGTTSWTYPWTLPADGSYTIQSRATDSYGNVEAPGPSITVTVDRTRPSVSLTDPTNGATDVTKDSDVTITWDENINCATVDTSSVTISPAPATSWTRFSCTGPTDTAVFRPVGQADSTVYTVTVSPGSPNEVEDLAGNAMASPYVFSYTTSAGDTTPPQVSSTVPTNGATGVTLDSNVTITWDENIDCATVNTTNITINNGSGWALSSCTEPTDTAVFTTSGQANSTTYQVTVSTSVTDVAGNPMASNYVFSYTTAVPDDTEPPTSTITAPADSATLNIASFPYTITGTATDNVAVSTVQVSINRGAWQTATGTTSWSYSWTLPAAGLDTNFTIQSRATDSAGNVETPSAGNTVTVDTFALSVYSTNPPDGATGVFLDSKYTINFNDDVDCATVNATNIYSDIPGWAFSTCSGSQVVFTTNNTVASDTTYSVTVTTDVTDDAGNPMGTQEVFSFVTRADVACDVGGANYKYVDGDNKNSTSPYTSWADAASGIDSAVGVANPGDVICIKASTAAYTKGFTVPDGVHLVAEKPGNVYPQVHGTITFSGDYNTNQGTPTILEGVEIVNQSPSMYMKPGTGTGINNNVIVRGVIFNGGGKPGIKHEGGAPIIEDSVFFGKERPGIRIVGEAGNLDEAFIIRRNEFYGNSGAGSASSSRYHAEIFFDSYTAKKSPDVANHVLIQDNIIRNNNIRSGIVFGPGTHSAHITGNEIYGNPFTGIHVWGQQGTEGVGKLRKITISGEPDFTYPTSENCYGNGDPVSCCTGLGTGTCGTDYTGVGSPNLIHDNGRGGVTTEQTAAMDIISNDIFNNAYGGIATEKIDPGTQYPDWVGFAGTSGTAKLTIRKNYIHGNGTLANTIGGGISVRHGYVTISNNVIYGNNRAGIRVGDYVTNNYECTAAGTPYECCTGSGTGTCGIKYNTVVGNGSDVDMTPFCRALDEPYDLCSGEGAVDDPKNNMPRGFGGGIVYDDVAIDDAFDNVPKGDSANPIEVRYNIIAYTQRAALKGMGFYNTLGEEERDYNLLYANNQTLSWMTGDCGGYIVPAVSPNDVCTSGEPPSPYACCTGAGTGTCGGDDDGEKSTFDSGINTRRCLRAQYGFLNTPNPYLNPVIHPYVYLTDPNDTLKDPLFVNYQRGMVAPDLSLGTGSVGLTMDPDGNQVGAWGGGPRGYPPMNWTHTH
ncbi:Ig-like domain-containing protein [Thermodesulfobacteriota bacterium]